MGGKYLLFLSIPARIIAYVSSSSLPIAGGSQIYLPPSFSTSPLRVVPICTALRSCCRMHTFNQLTSSKLRFLGFVQDLYTTKSVYQHCCVYQVTVDQRQKWCCLKHYRTQPECSISLPSVCLCPLEGGCTVSNPVLVICETWQEPLLVCWQKLIVEMLSYLKQYLLISVVILSCLYSTLFSAISSLGMRLTSMTLSGNTLRSQTVSHRRNGGTQELKCCCILIHGGVFLFP